MSGICVVPEGGSAFSVRSGGTVITREPCGLERALEIAGLLLRCEAGDQDACVELDRLGLEPPLLELDKTEALPSDLAEKAGVDDDSPRDRPSREEIDPSEPPQIPPLTPDMRRTIDEAFA